VFVQLAKTRHKCPFFQIINVILNIFTEGKVHAQTVPALTDELHIPHLPDLLRHFLFQQLHPDDPHDPSDVPLAECPLYLSKIAVFNSASSQFYAPSDLSGIGGMRTEHICSCPSWQGGHSCNDCVFVNTDSNLPGMQGLKVTRSCIFFILVPRRSVSLHCGSLIRQNQRCCRRRHRNVGGSSRRGCKQYCGARYHSY
jgi:hypothetical protein